MTNTMPEETPNDPYAAAIEVLNGLPFNNRDHDVATRIKEYSETVVSKVDAINAAIEEGARELEITIADRNQLVVRVEQLEQQAHQHDQRYAELSALYTSANSQVSHHLQEIKRQKHRVTSRDTSIAALRSQLQSLEGRQTTA